MIHADLYPQENHKVMEELINQLKTLKYRALDLREICIKINYLLHDIQNNNYI